MTIDPANLVDSEGGPPDATLFSDQEVYSLELRHIFSRCWLFLGHESQIPGPGDFMQTRMGNQPIILVRNAQGDIRAFKNYCRHRGYRVCHVDQGRASRFVCDLHGWTYDLDGKLVSVSGYEEQYYSEPDQYQWGLIPVVHLASYRGLIFGAFDPEAMPLEEYLGEARRPLERMLDQRAGCAHFVGAVFKWFIRTNWKLGAAHVIGDDFTVFPNASFTSNSNILHLWHPLGPTTTEVCALLMVDEQTPEEVKREMIARDYPLGYAMGIGRDPWATDDEMGRRLDANLDASNQRAFYRSWAQFMSANSWDDLHRPEVLP